MRRWNLCSAAEHVEDLQELVIVDNGIGTMAVNDPEQDLHLQFGLCVLQALDEHVDRIGWRVLQW